MTAWSGRDARIKWPNDVRVDHRKIAGILVERGLAPGSLAPPAAEHPGQRPRGVVIGIGLNVNMAADSFPANLSPTATSLAIVASGGPIDRPTWPATLSAASTPGMARFYATVPKF